MHARTFDKRIYTLPTFLASVSDLFHHRGDLHMVVRRRHIDPALAEKLMLVVTEVNRCRYCHFVHTHAALRAGVTEQELSYLRAHDFAGLPVKDAAALQFAQHYAEQQGRYDQASSKHVVELYGL